MTPLSSGTRLAQVADLPGFQKWDLIGISTLGDVWEGSHIKSLEALRGEFTLHNSQFYRYLQLRYAQSSYRAELVEVPELSPLEVKLLMGPVGRGGVSHI